MSQYNARDLARVGVGSEDGAETGELSTKVRMHCAIPFSSQFHRFHWNTAHLFNTVLVLRTDETELTRDKLTFNSTMYLSTNNIFAQLTYTNYGKCI